VSIAGGVVSLAKASATVRYSLPATSQGHRLMRDTTSAAAAAQAQAQRQLGGPGRLRLSFEMSVLARELTLAGLRRSHPDWSPRQLRRELLRLCFLPGELPRPLR
jgi:hypothetical protein